MLQLLNCYHMHTSMSACTPTHKHTKWDSRHQMFCKKIYSKSHTATSSQPENIHHLKVHKPIYYALLFGQSGLSTDSSSHSTITENINASQQDLECKTTSNYTYLSTRYCYRVGRWDLGQLLSSLLCEDRLAWIQCRESHGYRKTGRRYRFDWLICRWDGVKRVS